MRAADALRRNSIWSKGAIPAEEGWASREMKRYVLPAFDLVLILMAAMALHGGMPSFDLSYDPIISTGSAWILLIAASLAFAGISFPKLWVAEAIGKIGILGVIGGYAGALWARVFQGDLDRGFIAAGLLGLLFLPLWNLARLGRERRAREAKAEAERQARDAS